MTSIFSPDVLSLLSPPRSSPITPTVFPHQLSYCRGAKFTNYNTSSVHSLCSSKAFSVTAASASNTNSAPPKDVLYTVGDFMTRKEELHVVKPTTTIDEALESLVDNRITGFPVVDDAWKLVGVVSDYDLLALDSISGTSRTTDAFIFPEVDSNWKTFNEVQKLISKTNGQVVGDVMTAVPLVVRETTNLEDAARLLLKTKYRRLPVVDGEGKLVGLITRGNVVSAALQIKRATEMHE